LKSDNDRKKFNYSDKNLPHYPFVRHKPHKDGHGSNADLRNDRAGTNRYYVTVPQLYYQVHYINIETYRLETEGSLSSDAKV